MISSGKSSSIKVLTDEVEGHSVLGFDPYAQGIVDMINGTNPRFSIGVYGEWGSGKTTLMELIRNKLEENKKEILTIWFNAWRYEREEQLAITALMKTIAYKMGEHDIYKEIKPIIIRSLTVITKGVLSGIVGKILGDKVADGFTKEKILPYMDLFAEIDKDTIYFDGIHKIEQEMNKILKLYGSSRVVIFIDDLDRCSPKKALEVFESVKVFLDINGFVFIIGLSHDTISKLIEAEYEKSKIKGDEYIRKIIQIPITLPHWNNADVNIIIDNLINTDKIDRNYSKLINENKGLIASVVEPSPREVKRFINNFIISYKIYSGNPAIKPKELLVIQAIKFRWKEFYKSLSSDKEFRAMIKKLIQYEYKVIACLTRSK